MSPAKLLVGQPLDRTDGRDKVTGRAQYAAEFALPRLCHAVLVQSTVASGHIASIERASVERMPGVLQVLTFQNAQRLPDGGKGAFNPPAGRMLSLLQDDKVSYNGEPIAVVIAETLEQARHGAQALKVRYQTQNAMLDFDGGKVSAIKPKDIQGKPTDSNRGDVASAPASAAARVQAIYTTPIEHHNPMEPHATIAHWQGDKLTLYDATQYISGVKRTVSKTLGIAAENVEVHCPFTGGGFGCKGSAWSHVVLAAMAAQKVGRPVKLVLDRTQMFGPVGGRPNTQQTIDMCADADGQLTSIKHDVISYTSTLEDWTEPSAMQTRMLYSCENESTSHRLVKLNLGTPTFMRAPGEASGTFALDSAVDELAYKLKIDPLQMRLASYAEKDPESGKPFSSKSLKQCYSLAAERFGWSKRSMAPRSMREGHELIGWGMATATYPTNRSKAAASATLRADGVAVVRSGSQDLGTGTYTVMTQIAADALGFPVNKVLFELGDSRFPEAPVSGGSQTVASLSPAVQAAAQALRAKLIATAIADGGSPLHGVESGDVTVANGWLSRISAPAIKDAAAAVVARLGAPIEASAETKPGEEKEKFSMHSFGAVFVEVRVDEDLGIVRVPRVVAAYGIGKLLNAKTGHSQLMGGIVWGLSLALLEHSQLDRRSGRFVNANLSEYHVPVNADIQSIDISVVDEEDPYVNPLGAKGIGEIGITGVGAAVANAVFHATGKRVRDLPITLDKLLPQTA